MMKTLRTIKYSLLVILALNFTSCSDDDDVITIDLINLADVIAQDSELTSLSVALERTGLDEVLRASSEITIVAPTNAAFDDFLGTTPIEDVPLPVLEQLLLNHVIGERIPSVAITAAGSGYANTGAAGPNNANLSIYFEYEANPNNSGIVFNGVALVEAADRFGTNGVLHKVNAVVELPTIATFATANPALSRLVDALVLADTGDNPTIDWIDTVSNPDAGPFTIFAPTNQAFDDLADEVGQEIEGLGPDIVDSVLLMHVANGNVQSTELEDLNGTIPTLGGDLDLDVETLTITDGLGRDIIIIETLVDIQSVNGVVHVVDTVIRPAQ